MAGAGFSITHGISTIRHGEDIGDYLVSYIVLAVSFGPRGHLVGPGGPAGPRRGRPLAHHAAPVPAGTPDTTVKAVFLEDSAALIGLAAGRRSAWAWPRLTGDPVWDGLASIGIGLLLLVVAGILARANVSLLVGQSVPRRLHRRIERRARRRAHRRPDRRSC